MRAGDESDSETREHEEEHEADEPGGVGANRSSSPPGDVFVDVRSAVAVISSPKKPVSYVAEMKRTAVRNVFYSAILVAPSKPLLTCVLEAVVFSPNGVVIIIVVDNW